MTVEKSLGAVILSQEACAIKFIGHGHFQLTLSYPSCNGFSPAAHCQYVLVYAVYP